jgi:hypothetical protein
MHETQEGALALTGYLATSTLYFLTHISPANPHRFKESTSGLEPLSCSLRVIGQALQGFARSCKCRLFRGVSFLRLAACCTVLRSRWYQSGIRASDSYRLTVGPMARPRDLRSHNPPTFDSVCFHMLQNRLI